MVPSCIATPVKLPPPMMCSTSPLALNTKTPPS
jgi:hypothetical protein